MLETEKKMMDENKGDGSAAERMIDTNEAVLSGRILDMHEEYGVLEISLQTRQGDENEDYPVVFVKSANLKAKAEEFAIGDFIKVRGVLDPDVPHSELRRQRLAYHGVVAVNLSPASEETEGFMSRFALCGYIQRVHPMGEDQIYLRLWRPEWESGIALHFAMPADRVDLINLITPCRTVFAVGSIDAVRTKAGTPPFFLEQLNVEGYLLK